MGTYFSLQRKKFTKSKLTLISVVILLIISLTILYFNSKALNGNNFSIKGQLEGNIMLQKASENFTGFLLIAGCFSVANLLLFIFASVFSGTGNLAFPIIIQQLVKGKTVIKCAPTGDLILPIIIL